MVREKLFTLAIIQARMSSSRLPGKVMMPVNRQPMIYRQIERIKRAATVDEIIVATSIDASDDALCTFLDTVGVRVFRGALNDVLSRFVAIQENEKATAIVRLTGDCPLVMPKLIDSMVKTFYGSDVDYLSNTLELSFPDGLDVELIRPSALKKLMKYNLSSPEREHVTLGIYTRPLEFTLENFKSARNLSDRRWTVDYIEDLEFVRRVYLYFQGNESSFTLEDMITLMARHPDYLSAISPDRRNEKLGGPEIG